MRTEASLRFWTIPNVLSMSRVGLLPVWWMLMSSADRTLWWWGGGLVVYGIASDVLDGYLARRWHQISEWGKILDPVGDKIVAAVVSVFCVMHRSLPVAALALTVARDLGLVAAGWIVYRRVRVVPSSIDFGRYAALAWGITLAFYAFDCQPYARLILWPVVIVYLAAGVLYVVRRRRVVSGGV